VVKMSVLWFGIFISPSIPNGVSELGMMGKKSIVMAKSMRDKNEVFFEHGHALWGGEH
jgi:hypothetical protein